MWQRPHFCAENKLVFLHQKARAIHPLAKANGFLAFLV